MTMKLLIDSNIMHRSLIFFVIAVIFKVIILAPVFADGGVKTDRRDYYSQPGVSPYEATIADQFNENISPFNGIIQLSYTDISLPGNGGMDINVVRRYSSSAKNLGVHSVYGYGWDISFGKMHSASLLCGIAMANGGASTADNPVFETPEGSQEMLLLNNGVMSSKNAELVSRGRYALRCENVNGSTTKVVYSPNGTRYELGYYSVLTNKAYVTKISDKNGNAIRINYESTGLGDVYITSVTGDNAGIGNSDNRVVKFSYRGSGDLDIRLDRIYVSDGINTKQVRYSYEKIKDYQKSKSPIFRSFDLYYDYPNYYLLGVTRPDGTQWGYEYHVEGWADREKTEYNLWVHLLKEVRSPFGGKTTYDYQNVYFGDENLPNVRLDDYTEYYSRPHQAIKTKTIHPSATDRFTSGLVWDYEFYPGSAQFSDDIVVSTDPGEIGTGHETIHGDYTRIFTPYGEERYIHYGHALYYPDSLWEIGLPIAKQIYINPNSVIGGGEPYSGGGQLFLEFYFWEPQKISSENYWNGRDPNRTDSQTNGALLNKKVVFQGGMYFTTEYLNHDEFGNPGKIVKTGSNMYVDFDSLSKTISYDIKENNWIINLPEDETIADVGMIDRTYDANGNLTMENRFGVTTNYTYNKSGDIETVTDANNKVTQYLNYYRGVARTVNYPENKTITSTVDYWGNKDSVSDGRGNITRFKYDLMNRLTSIDYPIYSDVSIEYPNSNQRILTRGDYQETTYFDTQLNPVKTQRTDLVSGQTITSVKYFDIEGRETFSSLPTYSDYPAQLTGSELYSSGTVTLYDPLGRVFKVSHPDGSYQLYNYPKLAHSGYAVASPASADIIDERGHKTVLSYVGYGSPENKWLEQIDSPENIRTSITRNRLGLETRIWQGENGGLGHNRRYKYDSRYYLESEDNPETGHTVFTHDNLGNIKTYQIKNSDISGSILPDSGITTFFYDDLNRLTFKDYPGTTPDVTYKYDEDDRVTLISNKNSSRTYHYDENGNLYEEIISIGSETYKIMYGINSLDFVNTITYPSGRTIEYLPDAFGRASQVSSYIDTVTYYPGGQIDSLYFSNGVRTSYGLNERNWINSILASGPGGSAIDLRYDYDSKANVKTIVDGNGINSRSFLYDDIDRLISADGMWGTGSYKYDHEGNIRSKNIAGNFDKFSVEDGKMKQFIRNGTPLFTPPFDAYGNQLKTDNYNLIFNDANQLIQASKINVLNEPDINFEYDGNNIRVRKTKGAEQKNYVYNKASQVMCEVTTNTGHVKENIYLGSMMVASHSGNDDPVAVIDAPTSVLENVTVSLDGSSSYDSDGAIARYSWKQISGVEVTLVDAESSVVNFNTPFISQDEVIVIELSVTDDKGNIDTDQVSITIQLIDSDSDGLSDAWENYYLPGMLSYLSATGDYDNDGYSDLEEFTLGSDPTAFNKLNKPGDLEVSTTFTDATLSWSAVNRANRYAVYWSETSQVTLDEARRKYVTENSFYHGNLMMGQYIFYIVVAERVDEDGNVFGASDPSDIKRAKIGWNLWPENIAQAGKYYSVTSLDVGNSGDVLASLNEGSEVRYTRGESWSVLSNPEVLAPVNNINVKVSDNVSVPFTPLGLYAEYYDTAAGIWGNKEQIISYENTEWILRYSEFNEEGYGVAALDSYTHDAMSAIFYNKLTGWNSAQIIPVTEDPEFTITVKGLSLNENGKVQVVYQAESYDVNTQTTTIKIGAISYDPLSGWGNQQYIVENSEIFYDLQMAGNGSGSLMIMWSEYENGIYNQYAANYDSLNGWNDSQLIFTRPLKHSIYSFPSDDAQISMDMNQSGVTVVAYNFNREPDVRIQQFLPDSGWQLPVTQSLPVSCTANDVPANIQDYGPFDESGNPFPLDITGSIENISDVDLSVKISRDNQISLVSNLVSDFVGSSWGVMGGLISEIRYEPQQGWLPESIIYCPLGLSSSAITFKHDMNEYGTTFIMWTVRNYGDVSFQIFKTLSNRFELQKGIEPVANGGLDQTITEGATVTLDGSLSSDGDNNIASYHWKQISGPTVDITNFDETIASFVAPFVGSDTNLVFELSVTDAVGNVSKSDVTISVTDYSTTELAVEMTLDKVSPINQGETLSLEALATGGSGGAYEYQYRLMRVNPSGNSWEIIKPFDSTSSFSLDTTGLNGEYTIQIQLRETGNESVVVNDAASIWINSSNPVVAVSLAVDAESPQVQGSMVNLTATAVGGNAVVEYQYLVMNPSSQNDWVVLRDFSESAVFSWDTSTYPGQNTIKVLSRSSGSNDQVVEASIQFWVNSEFAVTEVSMQPDLLSPQVAGATVTLNTSIIGGNGNIEYQFSVRDMQTESAWVVTQPWSDLSGFSWNTTGLYGQYEIKAEARNKASSDQVVTSIFQYWINGADSVSTLELQMDKLSPVVTGTTVHFVAVPDNSPVANEYQYEIKSANSVEWRVLRSYSADPEYDFLSANYPGENIIRVKARKQGSLDKEITGSKVILVTDSNPVTNVQISTPNQNVMWGNFVQLNLTLTGGDGEYYQVIEFALPGQDFSSNTDFTLSSSNTIQWRVPGSQVGEYQVRVRVMDAVTDKPVTSNVLTFTVQMNVPVILDIVNSFL